MIQFDQYFSDGLKPPTRKTCFEKPNFPGANCNFAHDQRDLVFLLSHGNFGTWNAKCPIFLGNFTPKTSNYCLKNRALGFPGSSKCTGIFMGFCHFTVSSIFF